MYVGFLGLHARINSVVMVRVGRGRHSVYGR